MTQTVLVIEDNPNNRYLTTYLLEGAGFRVVTAENGLLGLEAARRLRPDLILLDIQMPEMDGYEAALRLRAERALALVPIVGVSSFAGAGDRARALAGGFTGYLEKPIDPDTFVDQIRQFIPAQGGSTP